MAMWLTEYLEMACNRWYEEAQDGRFWLFSDALFGWVKHLKQEDLAEDDAEALDVFEAMLILRPALPVHDRAFKKAVRRLNTSGRDRGGCSTVVTRTDADGVRIVIQDSCEAAARSIPAVILAAAPEEPRGRKQVPIVSFGIPCGYRGAWTRWFRLVALGCSGLPGHKIIPPPRSSLVASPVASATTAPSFGAGPVIPAVSTVARVATAYRLPLAPPKPNALLQDPSTALGAEDEVGLERRVGCLRSLSAGLPTSILLVSMVDLLGSLANNLFTWEETHPVGDPDALEAVLQGWSRSGVKDQLWSLLKIHQQRQENHLRRVEKAGIWRDRGSGTCDPQDDGARAYATWYRDAIGSPQSGNSGGGNPNWGGGYYNE